jgi:hypothetical protein
VPSALAPGTQSQNSFDGERRRLAHSQCTSIVARAHSTVNDARHVAKKAGLSDGWFDGKMASGIEVNWCFVDWCESLPADQSTNLNLPVDQPTDLEQL